MADSGIVCRGPYSLDNDYFTILFDDKWTVRPNFKPIQYEDTSRELMMLPTDMVRDRLLVRRGRVCDGWFVKVIVQDPKFRQWARKYADDMDLFHRDFAAAFAKLIELGVPR